MSSFPAHPLSHSLFTFSQDAHNPRVTYTHTHAVAVSLFVPTQIDVEMFFTLVLSHTNTHTHLEGEIPVCFDWYHTWSGRSNYPQFVQEREVKLIGNGPILSNRQSWSKSCQIDCLYRFSDGSFGWSDCVRLKGLGRRAIGLNVRRFTVE